MKMATLGFFMKVLCNASPFKQIQNVPRLLLKSSLTYTSKQALFIANNYGNWKPDDRTVAFIINKRMDTNLCISHIGTEGFLLASGTQLVGPMIVFPHSLLSWHVQSANDVTEESLALFRILEPKIELLVFGYGRRQDYTAEIQERFSRICKDLGLRFEALPTEQACGLFNFLASDHQYVAAALIPPSEVDILRLDRRQIFYLEEGEDKENDEDDINIPLINDNKTRKKLLK